MQEIAPLVVVGLLMTGCTRTPELESHLDKYRGLHKHQIVEMFGEPVSITIDADGLKILSYGQSGVLKDPDCIANFYLNNDDRLQGLRSRGTNCKAFESLYGDFYQVQTASKPR